MLGNVTASVALAMQLTEQQDAGVYKDENSALAKMFTASKLRETVALAREVCGGTASPETRMLLASMLTPKQCIPTKAPTKSTHSL